jgi:DNA polymerase-3 subunit gamma/tau
MYYLKYRPQKISELDLEEIREGLTRVLSSGRLSHAFLFAGPRGTGKTSAARIIAKAVNCKSSGFEPCNRCSMCKAITAGTALDLIEIDAASNRGIDDVRYLREKIKLTPVRSKYKVYIIDEVHMLTNEAFNALLKTLEEPPSHAIFILCTTQPEKLPPTIISRCTRFNFRKGRPDELIRCLRKVVKGEKLRIEKEALSEIAKHVDGSFRDAQKMLEQLSLRRRKITVEMVKEELGKSRDFQPETLLEFLVEKDGQQAIEEINKAIEGGVNLGSYIEDLLLILRDYLLQSVNFSDQVESLPFGRSQLVRLIELFMRAGREVKTAIIPQLPLELAIIEWCGSTDVE